MSKTIKRSIGDQGEGVACTYLISHGWDIVERNYWKPWGEIDIVAKKGEMLAFVEVKTVSCESFTAVSRETLRPEENMTPFKLRKLHRVVQTYLIAHKIKEKVPWRIDLACVYLDTVAGKGRVEMFESLF